MAHTRRIAVVTGTRAEFGLLRPVMRAVEAHNDLQLLVFVTGVHLIGDQPTVNEVMEQFEVTAMVPMQQADQRSRLDDSVALGRGTISLAQHFRAHRPDVVLVLGDRIEAFAAATAAAVAGIRVAHMHGGDRAEGLADESLRHAITKLAHIHLPATQCAADRIIRMGEQPSRVYIVGSPAIDELDAIEPLNDDAHEALGRPDIVFLLHPSGDDAQVERERADQLLQMCQKAGRVLAMMPNHDPGREHIVQAIESHSKTPTCEHLPREQFIGLLRRAKVLIGNSSAGLIEASALNLPCVNVGRRQAGRLMPEHVVDVPDWSRETIERALREAMTAAPADKNTSHPYGDGTAGQKTADLLAGFDEQTHGVKKLNTF